MPKTKILILTTKYGHHSIATSIAESLNQAQIKCHVYETTHPTLHLYQPFYIFFPALFKVPYKLSDRKSAKKIFHNLAKRHMYEETAAIIEKYQPTHIISTWYYFNPVLEKLQSHFHFRFLNVITDPRTFHLFIPSPRALNLVFDQKAYDLCRSFSIPTSQIAITGWFVRQSYRKPYSLKRVRKKLGLDPHKPTLLITTGSEGTSVVLKIIPSLLRVTHPAQVIFSCGQNKALYQLVSQSRRIQAHLNNSVTIIPLRYTPDLSDYVKAADIVIGKAGPNALFETVATRTPFFAITHIAGQEDGNLDIIREYGLGLVEENILQANLQINHLIYHIDSLSTYQKSLQSVAKYNSRAHAKLLKLIRSTSRNGFSTT